MNKSDFIFNKLNFCMSISMNAIKDLRDKTGAGMVDCKNALEEAAGDIDKAVELLRKKGIARAAKRGERQAREGLVRLAVDSENKEGYILEINAETDFVVRSDRFQKFSQSLIEAVKINKPENLDKLMSMKIEGGEADSVLGSLSGIIGEKLEIKQYDKIKSKGTVSGYLHPGDRVGVVLALDKSGQEELGRDIAMQIAATNPRYISPEDVLSEEIEKEKDIYREQLRKEGKKEEIIDKIIGGKINKYLEEVCLLNQEYIKEDKKKVSDILGEVKVEKFVRYDVGQ